MEKTMTPEESLQIIQKSIVHSRENMREGSHFYILWGWALILGALSNYVLIRYLISQQAFEGIWWKSLLTWLVFVGTAFIIQLVMTSRFQRKKMVKTHLSRYISTLWLSAGIVMALMVFFAIKLDTYPTALIQAITAIPTFVSGNMVRYIPLMVGGAIFLIASVIALHVNGTDQLLVFAGAVLLGYLVPGYILRYTKNGDDV